MRKLSVGEWVAATVAVVFVSYTLFGANIMGFFQKNKMSNENNEAAAVATNPTTTNAGGVTIQEVVVGEGALIKPGDRVAVHYVLALADGTVIQNSKDFGTPFQFTLGAGEVIPGWEQGFAGAKIGGVRMITIPPELAYGANQAGPIPPNSTLVFTVEILDAAAPSATPTAQPAQ